MANKGGGNPGNRRDGKRRDRNQRVGIRVPELGYYLIVTDTEETVKQALELVNKEPQYRIPWIVFDRDRVAV